MYISRQVSYHGEWTASALIVCVWVNWVDKLLLPFGASARRRLCNLTWDNVLCYVPCARAVIVKSWHGEETNESIRLFVQSREQSVIRWKSCYACLETFTLASLCFFLSVLFCSVLSYKLDSWENKRKNVCTREKCVQIDSSHARISILFWTN